MTLEEVFDSLPETVDVFLFTEEDDSCPAAIYDGRNSINGRYNSREVRFLTAMKEKVSVGVYGKKIEER